MNQVTAADETGHLIAKSSRVKSSGFGVCVWHLCGFSLEGFYTQNKSYSLG